MIKHLIALVLGLLSLYSFLGLFTVPTFESKLILFIVMILSFKTFMPVIKSIQKDDDKKNYKIRR